MQLLFLFADFGFVLRLWLYSVDKMVLYSKQGPMDQGSEYMMTVRLGK